MFDDPTVVLKQYQKLGEHFVETKEYQTAELLFINGGLYSKAVDMYNNCKQWEKAHQLASQYLDSSEVNAMYIKQAQELEADLKFRDAEKLYLSVGEPDLAIAMYKRNDHYDNMVRLVQRFHPDLLETTHIHLGQKLEQQQKYKMAETHYLAASKFKVSFWPFLSVSDYL